MTLAHVYRVLARVQLEANLRLDCPGGHIDCRTAAGGEVVLDCSSYAAVQDLLDLAGHFRPDFSLRNFRYLKSPLLQTLEVYVAGKRLLVWRPETLPRVTSFSGLLRLLRG
ncbi:MAG: hypothetical protein AAFN92_02280 [Bacteroidota bacterium]